MVASFSYIFCITKTVSLHVRPKFSTDIGGNPYLITFSAKWLFLFYVTEITLYYMYYQFFCEAVKFYSMVINFGYLGNSIFKHCKGQFGCRYNHFLVNTWKNQDARFCFCLKWQLEFSTNLGLWYYFLLHLN